MTVSREPDSPALAERRAAPPDKRRRPASAVQRRVLEAAKAASAGDEELARRLLDEVLAQPDPAGLAKVEEVLAELGRADSVSGEVRAQALSAYALSRAHRGDDGGAVRAMEDAVALSPTPGRVAYLSLVASRAAGPDAARRILDDGLERWPDDATLLTQGASLALQAGALDRAREQVERALQHDRAHADALALLARLELVANRPEAAIEPAREVVRSHPSLGRALLAIALDQSGRLVEDPGVVTAVLADLPDDVWVLSRFAEVLLDSGQPVDARRVLDRALELAPDAIGPLRVRGMTNALLGDFDAAAQDLDRAARAGDDPWLTSMRGEIARLRGDPATAARLFQSLAEDEEPSWVPSSLGQALVALNDISGAQQAYERALERSPKDVNALCGLGEIRFEYGGEEGMAEGEALLRRALEAESENPRAQALLAEVLRRTGRLEAAVEHFDQALDRSPRYVYALASKGQTLVAMGEVANGVELLMQAAQEAPTTAWILDELVSTLETHEPHKADARLRGLQRQVRDRRGDILPLCVRRAQLAKRQERWADAEGLYRKARDLAPPGDIGLAKEHIGVLERLGRVEEALEILDLLPGDVVAADVDLRWQRIDLLWRLERLNEARAELQRLEKEDSPPMAAAALGEIYRMEGRRDEARRLLEQAQQREADNPFTLASLGALELDEGRVEEARQHLRRAVELQPDYEFAFGTLASLELNQGNDDAVFELLQGMSDVDPGDPKTARLRARALYGLGEYLQAVRLLDACLVESGDDAGVLRLRGWLEIALGQSYRAAQSFLSSVGLPDDPSGLLELVNALTRVDRWQDARRLVASRPGNPYVDTATAVIWMHVGDWETGARHALAGRRRLPQSQPSASIAAQALHMTGAHQEALKVAQEAHDASPLDVVAMGQLAECLLAAGRHEDARGVFQELHDRLSRRVHLDADDLNMQGWCLLRLGRVADSARVFLKALSATDRTASVLLNLALASFLGEDLRQANILVKRAREEFKRLSPPTRRGVIAMTINDIASFQSDLRPPARVELVRLANEFRVEQAALDKDVEEASRLSPLASTNDR